MRHFASLALCLGLLTAPAFAQQNTATQPSNPPAKHGFPKPRAEAAPGGAPDKVWVNTNSKVYHCYGDRYYGKTSSGKYMSEKDAIAFGAHASRGEKCSR